MKDIAASFRILYPGMATDGIYLVEGLHAAYEDHYHGGLGRSETFIELCKVLIDELNAQYTRGALPETKFSKTTLSIYFYNSVLVSSGERADG